MAANDIQIGGSHYATASGVQHWDMVVEHQLNYFEGQITKYVMRARKKNGKQDLEKAKHFLDKYLEVYDRLNEVRVVKPSAPLGTRIALTKDWREGDFDIELFDFEGYVGKQSHFTCKACRMNLFVSSTMELIHHTCTRNA
jgi:hypothetical protein